MQVICEDSNILCYGISELITQLDIRGRCISINLQEILTKLEINLEKFVNLCVMFGTDYNDNVRNRLNKSI